MESFDKAFGLTKKSLGAISDKNTGHFFFVSDKKGEDVVLLVMPEAKDPAGQKTVTQGRKLLKDYKAERDGTPVYSQGTVLQEGSTLVFEIARGTAKPSVMKIGFKKSASLHEGVGPKKAALVSAKIRMAGQEERADTDDASEHPASSERQAALEAWRQKNAALLLEIGGMSNDDILELFDAESAFMAHREALRSPKSESVELELLVERNEAALASLEEKGATLLERIAAGDEVGARAAEAELDTARAALAAENAVGPLFTGDELDAVVQEIFAAALNQARAVLLSRLAAIRAEIAAERARLLALPLGTDREAADRTLQGFVLQRRGELADIDQQLARLSAAP